MRAFLAPLLTAIRDVVTVGRIHQGMPFQLGDRTDAGAMRRQNDPGGVLKDHGDNNVFFALIVVEQKAARADAEICTACGHCGAGIHARAPLANFDLEAVLAIKPFLDCGVVARELELVRPLELERHTVECVRRRYKQRRDTHCEEGVPTHDRARSSRSGCAWLYIRCAHCRARRYRSTAPDQPCQHAAVGSLIHI